MFDALFQGQAAWFGLPAVIGTIFFVVRLVLMLAGGAGEMAADVDADMGGADAADGHTDPGDAIKVLSVQSIAAFLMGFGWGGLTGHRGFELNWVTSLGLGVAVGVAMVWVLGLLLKAVHDLQSSGNVQIESALGTEGSVYVRVPAQGEGKGQVRLVVGGRQRIYSAVSAGDQLERNTRVRVTRVNDDNTLTVTTTA